jgi:hypothetical protein
MGQSASSKREGVHARLVDSRTLYYRSRLNGQARNWVDLAALQATWQSSLNENHHLAEVRVGGLNPVFRCSASVLVRAISARVQPQRVFEDRDRHAS